MRQRQHMADTLKHVILTSNEKRKMLTDKMDKKNLNNNKDKDDEYIINTFNLYYFKNILARIKI